MICLRCGHCCIAYDVMIVDDPAKGLRVDNTLYKPAGQRCKHLLGDKPRDYSCAIHFCGWYKRTPCYNHRQIEATVKDDCRIGAFVLEHLEVDGGGMSRTYSRIPRYSLF